MEIRGQKHIPLACRYVPYDQWFLTHVDPSWKIKHLKQLILAKSFSLPFDPRRLGDGFRDADGSRAPSPITFAPDVGHRPVSPIKFATPQELRKKKSTANADEGSVGLEENTDTASEEQGKGAGYEEDDEYDDEDHEDDDEELPSPIFPGGRVGSGGAGGLAGASGRIGAFPAHKPSQLDVEPTDTRKRKGRFNPLSKIGRSKAKSSQNDTPQEEEDGIQTAWFTLLRFTTGQVLEDDYTLSWYDLLPHELVEIHNSVPPANFAIASAFHQLLLPSSQANQSESRPQHTHSLSNGGGLVKSGVITTSADAASALASALLIPATSTPVHFPVPILSTQGLGPLTLYQLYTRTQHTLLANNPPSLTSLPRADPAGYAQPYWEGWVRTLRTVSRDPAPMRESAGPGGKGRFEYPEYSGGMVGGGGVGMVAWEAAFGGIEGGISGGERLRLKAFDAKDKGKGKESYRDGDAGGRDGHEGRDRYKGPEMRVRSKTTLEWRERWMVIKDGVVYLYKQREDAKPSQRNPLGALVNLRGVEHLATSIHSRPAHRTRSTERPHNASSNHPHEHHRRSASQPRAASGSTTREMSGNISTLSRPKAVANAVQDTSRDHVATRNLSRPPGLGVASTSLEQMSQGTAHQHHHISSRPLTEVEHRAAKEREERREQERHRERERRRIREKQEREIENLRRWDDLNLTFPFGGKSKEKDKDKDKDKEKAKDDKRRVGLEPQSKEAEREEEKEREKAREREKERGRERDREKERERRKREQERDREKEQQRLRMNDTTYLPTTREEAEAAGMKIVCAKFQGSRTWERQQQERDRLNAMANILSMPSRQYTSTGPSLAGNTTLASNSVLEDTRYDGSGISLREKLILDHAVGPGYPQRFAPRKASLPGLGHSVNNPGASTSLPVTTSAATGAMTIYGRNESSTASSSKFGIAGFFGKDKDSEKEEKKRGEKEKKAREKEQKMIEKERKKGKWREDDAGDDDDPGFGSSTSLKTGMGKKTKPALAALPEHNRVQPSRLQSIGSLSTADSSILLDKNRHVNSATSTSTVRRPKLTITPIVSPEGPLNHAVTKVESDSDSSSSLSMSSPVFAHSDSDGYEEDDIYGYGQPRRGYRYGGYHPPPVKHRDGKKELSGAAGVNDHKSGTIPSQHHMPNVADLRPETLALGKAGFAYSSHHHSRGKEREKEKGEDRGEWLVFDMGSDQAFHSILRIFHRQFLNPLDSDFLPASVPLSSSNPSGYKVGSPIQRTFWSTADHDAVNMPSAKTEGLPKAPSLLQENGPSHTAETSSHVYNGPDDASSSSTVQSLTQKPTQRPRSALHPQALTTLLPNSTHRFASLAPALPYPEWRTDLVHRARRYGLREAGRPLDLALYGWGRYSVDKGTSATYTKFRKKEEANRGKIRESIKAFNGNGKSMSIVSSWDPEYTGQSDNEDSQTSRGAEADGGAEGRHRRDWEASKSRRRMSTVSHVSTIKAPAVRSKASESRSMGKVVVDQEDASNESADAATDTDQGSDIDDSDSMGSPLIDDFEGAYAYGQDDEEGALAEGLGSIADSDEESEVEWLAWTTDLPRQHLVRQGRIEAERRAREMSQEERALSDSDSQPLSPMEFSDPFSPGNSLFISKNTPLPTVLPPIPPPKTPEEERWQYAEKLRKMEPSATSISLPASVPPLPISPRVSSLNALTTHQPAANIQGGLTLRTPSNLSQSGYNAQRYSATLSSPSSSESLSRAQKSLIRPATSTSPINTGFANALSRNHSNPMSPLGGNFSPADDDGINSSSLSTTPPSAVGSYASPAQRRAHSRSISSHSASQLLDDEDMYQLTPLGAGRATLHHSTSMPLTPSNNSGQSRGALSPRSPTRRFVEKGLTQPISMPILTPAQISQIESETEEKIIQEGRLQQSESGMTSLAPSPSVSPPSSYSQFPLREPSTVYGTMPRRSSSAGVTSASPSSSANTGVGIGRSASVRHKPLPPQPIDRPTEKGLLRKKRSDLGKNAVESGRDGEPGSPTVRQRPSLSLLGLSGNNSKTHIPLTDAQSPTQQRHPRGPRSAYPYQSHDHGYGPPSSPPTTFQSAKALLRRVRSGSSLKMDMHIEEVAALAESGHGAWPPNSPPPSGVITNAESSNPGTASSSRHRDASPPNKKKIGTIDRIVKGLDSALDFVDGR